MAKQPDPSISRHLAEQRLGEELLQDALAHLPAKEVDPVAALDADDVIPEFQETVVLCASLTRGRWMLVGRFMWDDTKEPPRALIKHVNPEALRSLLRARGYFHDSGQLFQAQETGAEIWKKGGGPL